MPQLPCDMCSGYGRIIRLSDGLKVPCPKCLGRGTASDETYTRRLPSPKPEEHQRPPMEILERKRQEARQEHTQNAFRKAIEAIRHLLLGE